jgi:ubiquinone/menaquinone biosynthesis C-methylase UbiE
MKRRRPFAAALPAPLGVAGRETVADRGRTAAARRQAFEARTETYRRLGHDRFAAARFVAEAAGELAAPALDVGTGKGLLAMALARRGLDVVSVDVNREDCELAAFLAEDAGLTRRIRFLIQDARELAIEDASFGCALMMDVLHHLEDAAPVLAEMVRVVRPGGTIVVADFSAEGFETVAAAHRGEGHEHPRSSVTVEEAKEVLSRAGCEPSGDTVGHLHRVVWGTKR